MPSDNPQIRAARIVAIGTVIAAIVGAIVTQLINPRFTSMRETAPNLRITTAEDVGGNLADNRSSEGDDTPTGGGLVHEAGPQNLATTSSATDATERNPDPHSSPTPRRITATGTGYPAANITGAGQRRAAARRAAKLDAMRQLAEAIQIHLRSKSKLKNQNLEDEIETRTNMILKEVVVIDEKQLPDEGVEITVEAPMAGQIYEPGEG